MKINRLNNLLELFYTQYQLSNKSEIFLTSLKQKKTFSWEDTFQSVIKLSSKISSIIQQGDRCLLISENRPEWMISDLSIMLSKGITVPSYTTYTERDYEYIINDCQPSLILVSSNELFKKILKNSFILSSITGFIISIIYFLFNDFAINLMSDIDEVKKLSSSFIIWLIILPFIASFCYQFDGIFIGASQTKELRNAMMFSVFCYLIISIVLTKYYSNTGVWISLCIFMILRALSLFYYLKNIIRRFN